MTKYLEFSTLAEAQAFANALATVLGYPKSETKTDVYTLPVEHPSDGRAICAVDGDALDHLTNDELAALQDPSDVEDFFPEGEPI
ncbi:MAG: hypothetical protein COA65_10185 [Rhodospirillaceae bacterium]|nr:MAG: hypothetical protein COA65_10185 [Rhodospirillaceae bacterium]